MSETNRRDFLAGLMSTALVLVPNYVRASDTIPAGQLVDSQIVNLSSLSDGQLKQLEKDVYAHRNSLMSALVDQLNSNETQLLGRLYAAFFIGVYRFPEAAPTLVKNIKLKDPDIERRVEDADALWIWSAHPAKDALIKLGGGCLPYVIDQLSKIDDSETIGLLMQVIQAITVYPECAKAVVSHALDQEIMPDQKARLVKVQATLS